MISQSVVFAAVVAVVLGVLLLAAGYAFRRAKRVQSDPSLEQLLGRLHAVDRSKLVPIAAALEAGPQHRPDPDGLENWQIWELIGGIEGFEAMMANCEVLIDLACHVQRWYPEALPVAEQLRLNAREIQWHLDRLKGAERLGHLQTVFPDYAQRAVSVYLGMTEHVLALYEASQVPGWSRLQTAL